MIRTIAKLLGGTSAALVLGFTLLVAAPQTQQAFATSHTNAACEGVAIAGVNCTDPGAQNRVKKLVTTIIDILSIIVGAVSVIMIIIGGLRYVTSAGDSTGTTAARNTIIYALVGLAVVIFAQSIVAFVIGRVRSADTT